MKTPKQTPKQDDGMPDNPPAKDYSPLQGQPVASPHARPMSVSTPIPEEIAEPTYKPEPTRKRKTPVFKKYERSIIWGLYKVVKIKRTTTTSYFWGLVKRSKTYADRK